LAPLALIDWLSHWLASWNRITARFVPLDDERLQRELLDPAARLVHLLPEGAAYLAQVRRWGEAARTLPVASVATHNDLTMQNLLWHPPNPPAVLDWEAARPDGLPLVDFFYAAVDAYSQAGRPADRVRVFQSCFGSAGDVTPSLTPLLERVREATATSPAAARVSFHACWIGHAVDEVEKHPEATSRPFLAIVRALSASSAGRSG
jgi:Ser/Thr protein kinase RdoA (MazF antagonist)